MITLTLPLVKSLSFKISKSASIKKAQVLEQFSKNYGFQNYRSFQAKIKTKKLSTTYEEIFIALYKASNLSFGKINQFLQSEKTIRETLLKEVIDQQERENDYYADIGEQEQERIAEEAADAYELQMQEQYGHLIIRAEEENRQLLAQAFDDEFPRSVHNKKTWQKRILENNILNDSEQLAKDYNRFCSRLDYGQSTNEALSDFDTMTAEIIDSLDFRLVSDRPKGLSEDPPFSAKDIELLLS